MTTHPIKAVPQQTEPSLPRPKYGFVAWLGRVCSYIPILSTFTAILDLFQKKMIAAHATPQELNQNLHIKRLHETSYKYIFLSLFPVVGNIARGISEAHEKAIWLKKVQETDLTLENVPEYLRHDKDVLLAIVSKQFTAQNNSDYDEIMTSAIRNQPTTKLSEILIKPYESTPEKPFNRDPIEKAVSRSLDPKMKFVSKGGAKETTNIHDCMEKLAKATGTDLTTNPLSDQSFTKLNADSVNEQQNLGKALLACFLDPAIKKLWPIEQNTSMPLIQILLLTNVVMIDQKATTIKIHQGPPFSIVIHFFAQVTGFSSPERLELIIHTTMEDNGALKKIETYVKGPLPQELQPIEDILRRALTSSWEATEK